MDIQSLLTRYSLSAQAAGFSPKTVKGVKLAVGLFDEFLGGIADIRAVSGDDLRRFIVALGQKRKWRGRPQETSKTLSAVSINSYVRAIKSFWSWTQREALTKENPLAAVPAPKLPRLLPKALNEEELSRVLKVAAGDDRDSAITQVLLDSGMRLAELVSLRLTMWTARVASLP